MFSLPLGSATKEQTRSSRDKQLYADKAIRTSKSYIGKFCYNLGEKGSGIKPRGEVQNFNKLRKECLEAGRLFEDPQFPANDSSLYFSRKPDRYIEWKRPKEIVDDPQLFVDGFSRFDVQQGELGDCWMLAAMANLTMHPNYFFQVVPKDQSFKENYAGIFHFRFWRYARWIDVVVDDRLPTSYGRLMYLHSAAHNEFWSALLEKAYAKVHGSYEALNGGLAYEAMEDFTGGISEMYQLDKAPPNLFNILLKAFERNSLLSAGIDRDPKITEAMTPQGLLKGHAYSITCVKHVKIQTSNKSGVVPLLRIRNPWGNKAEWNGAWSDQSLEWKFIPDREKKELGLTFETDGEFWMSFHDFKRYLNDVEICNLSPDSFTGHDVDTDKKHLEMSVFEGKWIRGITAGGCNNYLETFWHNPQYRITLEHPDDNDDKCTVIVALMQKNNRAQKKMGVGALSIGFEIYHLEYPERLPKSLDFNFFKVNRSIASSLAFINLREVTYRFELPPGSYCIIPSTYKPNNEGEFLLRIFSENKNNMEEHDKEVGIGEIDDRVHKILEQDSANIPEFFKKIAGGDLEVDWKELKNILNFALRKDTHDKGFSKDLCRSIIAMVDVDHSGKLGFEEFITLWNDILRWRAVFKLYEQEESGYLRPFVLRQALNSAGYFLNKDILNNLVYRYGTKDRRITFENYIMCVVKLKTMIDIFMERDPNKTNMATFTMTEWVEETLYSL